MLKVPNGLSLPVNPNPNDTVMTRKSIRLTWTTVFVTMFLVSLDYWRWDEAVIIGLLGPPRWINYFVLLQLLLAGAVFLFSRTYWKDTDGSGSEKGDDH